MTSTHRMPPQSGGTARSCMPERFDDEAVAGWVVTRRRMPAVLIVGLIAPAVALGHATATQGKDPRPAERQEHHLASPVILEAPLPATWGGTAIFAEFAKHLCAGVHIAQIMFDAAQKRRDTAQLRCRFGILVEPGDDTRVELVAAIVDADGTIVGNAWGRDYDAEEGKILYRPLKIPVTRELLEHQPPPSLCVTIRTRFD